MTENVPVLTDEFPSEVDTIIGHWFLSKQIQSLASALQQELFQEQSVVLFAVPSVPPVLKLPGDSTVHETMKTL